MKKAEALGFSCINCKEDVTFSLFDLAQEIPPINCSKCSKQYMLQDKDLKRQINKFSALCRQLKESEEILGNTSIAVTLGSRQVEIPYKLLLTRLNSKLTLEIDGQPLVITFRSEPSLCLQKK